MTNYQKQCLLAYLGLYKVNNTTIKLDGSFGSVSKTATKKFQKARGLDADGIFGNATEKEILKVIGSGITSIEDEDSVSSTVSSVVSSIVSSVTSSINKNTGTFWDNIKYFNKSEFECKCGCGTNNMQEGIVVVLDETRAYFNASITVSSGCRCATHNAKVGGVSNSRHMKGKAVDFRVMGKSATEVLKYLKTRKDVRYCYAINANYVHADIN